MPSPDAADDEVEVDAVAPVRRVDDLAGREDLDETVDVRGVVHERDEPVLADRLGHGVRVEQRELGTLVAAGVVGDDDAPCARQVPPVAGARQGREGHASAVGTQLDELHRPGPVVPREDAALGVHVERAPGGDLEEAVQQIGRLVHREAACLPTRSAATTGARLGW